MGSYRLDHIKHLWRGAISSDDPLHAWALHNRRAVEIGAVQIWLAPPEYVIIKKLEFLREGGSEKHVRDVRGILAVMDVDRPLLETQIAQRGLRDFLRKCTCVTE